MGFAVIVAVAVVAAVVAAVFAATQAVGNADVVAVAVVDNAYIAEAAAVVVVVVDLPREN